MSAAGATGPGDWVTPFGMLTMEEADDEMAGVDPATGELSKSLLDRLGLYIPLPGVAKSKICTLMLKTITITPVDRSEKRGNPACELQAVQYTAFTILHFLFGFIPCLSGSAAAHFAARNITPPSAVADSCTYNPPEERTLFSDYDFVVISYMDLDAWKEWIEARVAVLYNSTVKQVAAHGMAHTFMAPGRFYTTQLGLLNIKILKADRGRTAFTLADSIWIDFAGAVHVASPHNPWQAQFDLMNGIARPAYKELLSESNPDGMRPVDGLHRYLLEFARGRQCPDLEFIGLLLDEYSKEVPLALAADQIWNYLTQNKNVSAPIDHLLSMLLQLGYLLESAEERTKLWSQVAHITLEGEASDEVQAFVDALTVHPELADPISALLVLKAAQTECDVYPFHFDGRSRRYHLGRVVLPVSSDLNSALERLLALGKLSQEAAAAFDGVWRRVGIEWQMAPGELDLLRLEAAQRAAKDGGLYMIELILAYWRPDSSLEGVVADLVTSSDRSLAFTVFAARHGMDAAQAGRTQTLAHWIIYLINLGDLHFAKRALDLWRRRGRGQRLGKSGRKVITALCDRFPTLAMSQVLYFTHNAQADSVLKFVPTWCEIVHGFLVESEAEYDRATADLLLQSLRAITENSELAQGLYNSLLDHNSRLNGDSFAVRLPIYVKIPEEHRKPLSQGDVEEICVPTAPVKARHVSELLDQLERSNVTYNWESIWHRLKEHSYNPLVYRAVECLHRNGATWAEIGKKNAMKALKHIVTLSREDLAAKHEFCSWLVSGFSHAAILSVINKIDSGKREYFALLSLCSDGARSKSDSKQAFGLFLAASPEVIDPETPWAGIASRLIQELHLDKEIAMKKMVTLIERSRNLGITPAIHLFAQQLAANMHLKTVHRLLSLFDAAAYEASQREREETGFPPLWACAAEQGIHYPPLLDLDCISDGARDHTHFLMARLLKALLQVKPLPSDNLYSALQEEVEGILASEEFGVTVEQEDPIALKAAFDRALCLAARGHLEQESEATAVCWDALIQAYYSPYLSPWLYSEVSGLIESCERSYILYHEDDADQYVIFQVLPEMSVEESQVATKVVHTGPIHDLQLRQMRIGFATYWGRCERGQADPADLIAAMKSALMESCGDEGIVDDILHEAVTDLAEVYKAIGYASFGEMMLPLFPKPADEEYGCVVS